MVLARSQSYRSDVGVSGGWEALTCPVAEPTLPPAQLDNGDSVGTLIELAVSAFLAEHVAASAANTVKRYTLITRKLTAYAAAKGYVMIDQFSESISASFGTPGRSAYTFQVPGLYQSLFRVRARKRMDPSEPREIGEDAGQPRFRVRAKSVFPSRTKNCGECSTAASVSNGGKKPSATAGHDTEIKSSRSMVYTGLRICDVCTFRIDRLLSLGECPCAQHKKWAQGLHVGPRMAAKTNARPRTTPRS